MSPESISLTSDPQGCGSSQNQIAAFTKSINNTSVHIKKNPKDKSAKKGLMDKVSKRNRISRYLKRINPELYEKTRKKLGLRK